jgi:serine phosphatase RsbU (regulator of sigma subunit)
MKGIPDLLKFRSASRSRLVRVKEKLLINFIALTAVFSVFYIGVSVVIDYKPGAFVMCLNFLLFITTLILFTKKILSYNAAANIYIANCAFIAILLCTYYSGGIFSPVISWFILIPVISLLLLGIGRSSKIWLGVAIALVILFGTLNNYGFQSPVEYDLKWKNFFFITCLVGLAAIVFIITMIFERAKELALLKLEQKNKEMTDSIHYARRIQTTILAKQEFIDSLFEKNFVIYKPKDIVSGDYYWAEETPTHNYIAVCDCTGHGVPGAFMSLLTSGLLSAAINEYNIHEPHEIFNFVRTKLIQNVSKDGAKDGMDGTILCVNKENGKVTYAGANSSPVLIKNNEIIKLPKCRMPVGLGEINAPFKSYDLDLEKGDMIYLYTDGLPDLFGGPKGKKLTTKQLHLLLKKVSSFDTTSQKQQLEKYIHEWKGDWEQIDDICMIGVAV